MPRFKSLFSFSQNEIDLAFKNANTIKNAQGLKFLQTDEKNIEHGKILIITPRKLGKAHDRNKIRRQIKAIFFEEKLYEKPVISILLLYKEALDLTYEELKIFMLKSLRSNTSSAR